VTEAAFPPPQVSVLIPAWNAAGSIERAVTSVLDSPGISVECIVVDDASPDGTFAVIEAMARQDPRVIARRLEQNGGCSVARNLGLEAVRGEWLVFVDSDDRLLPGALEALLRPTADPGIKAVIGQRIWTDGERTWISPFYDNADIREPGRKSIATHPGLLYYASLTGKLFHRSLVTGLRFDGRVLGDQPYTLRALLRAGTAIEVIGDTVYEWTRPRPDEATETITASKQRSSERAAEMVGVATGAFGEVADEIDLTVADPGLGHRTKVAYLDRLCRSDLGGPVRTTIERHDPATARLYGAVGRFVASIPADVLGASRNLVPSVLRPPVGGWHRLDGPAREAYWTMLRPALAAEPRFAYRVAGLPSGLPRAGAVVIRRALRTRPGRALASVVLTLSSRLRAGSRRRPRSADPAGP
jgi:hypothetical protein